MLDPGFIATLLSDLESKDAFVYRPAIGFIQGFVKYGTFSHKPKIK